MSKTNSTETLGERGSSLETTLSAGASASTSAEAYLSVSAKPVISLVGDTGLSALEAADRSLASGSTANLTTTASAPVIGGARVNSSGSIRPDTLSTNPVLDLTLVQNSPAAPGPLKAGQTVTYTVTIKVDATSGATAANVLADVALADMTVNAGSIVVTDANAGASHTVSTTSSGFGLHIGENLSTSASTITVFFSATVNAGNATTADAGVTLTYQNISTVGDELIYGTQNFNRSGDPSTANFYRYDFTHPNSATYPSTSQAFAGYTGGPSDSLTFIKAADGSTGIVFSGGGNLKGDLRFYDSGNHTTTVLYTPGANHNISDLTISPDGKKIYFTVTNSSGQGALFSLAVNNGAPVAGSQVQLSTYGSWGNVGIAGVAFTPDGRLFGNIGQTNGYDGGNKIVQLNPTTGAIITTSAALTSGNATSLALDGMTYDSYTGNLFVSSQTSSGNNIFEINPNTLTVVKAFAGGTNIMGSIGPDGLVSDGKGNIFIAGVLNNIVRLDLTTGGGTFSVLESGLSNLDDVVPVAGVGSINTFSAQATVNDTVTSCFTAGTYVRVISGEASVEDLKIGDLVAAVKDGVETLKPIRWIGRRLVSVADALAHPLQVAPVRIKAGALGENLPARDLVVSPCHAFLVDGLLVHAGALVNDTSIIRETRLGSPFVYYHVELDDHSFILAEGVEAETFIDNVDRLGFDNWDEHQALYPEGHLIEEMALPRATSARQVPARIKARLEDRAAAIGERMFEVA